MVFFPTPVLVGVDATDESRHAVLTAVELCRATTSPLHLVHVTLTAGLLRGRPMTPTQRETTGEDAQAILERHRKAAIAAGVEPAQLHTRYGQQVEEELVRLQTELTAGLLIIGEGATGSLASRMFHPQLGSGTVRRSSGSVMVVRPPDKFPEA